MLTKQYRLQKDRDFELVFKKGRAFKSKFLFLKLKRNNLEISRFGFVIGKTISKKSTVRNRIKRRLRDIIERNLVKIKSGFDVIIGVNTKIVEKNYQEIKEELEELLKKAEVLKIGN